MAKLDAAIDVAAEYAYHLYRDDGVPRDKAVAAGVAAVVRAARTHQTVKSSGVTPRRQKDAGVGFDSSTLMGVGSVLSAFGWVRKIVTGG